MTRELLLSIPKTDLHCHLDGSLRMATILELAKTQGVDLPGKSQEDVARALHVGQICNSLEEYLQAFAVEATARPPLLSGSALSTVHTLAFDHDGSRRVSEAGG